VADISWPRGSQRHALAIKLQAGQQRMNAQDLLAHTWRGLIQRQGSDAAAAQRVLEELIGAYVEPGRQYHTLAHIAGLLHQLEQHGQGVRDRDAVALAIIFHDVIYDARRNDNEKQSAALAAARLTSLAFPAALVDKVVHYITATHHAEDLKSNDPDLALLLDLDLSTLAAAPEHYRTYAQAIRREYAHVPEMLYRAGRRRILEGFLARASIYRSAPLRALWEERARANISGELASLS
jgi:predicted metal-dependent HD superfamily phosphohydrolase